MNKGLPVGIAAPKFDLAASNNSIIRLADFHKQPVILTFFRGTWWPNCQNQLVQLNEYYQLFLNKGVQVLGIAGQNLKSIQQYVDKEEINIPILADETRSVIKQYEVFIPIKWDSFRTAIPSTYILDKSHTIQYSYIGKSQFDRPAIDHIIEKVQTFSHIDKY